MFYWFHRCIFLVEGTVWTQKTASHCSDQPEKTKQTASISELHSLQLVLCCLLINTLMSFSFDSNQERAHVCVRTCTLLCVWACTSASGPWSSRQGAVKVHWHHNTLTPFTMLPFFPSLSLLSPLLTAATEEHCATSRETQTSNTLKATTLS